MQSQMLRTLLMAVFVCITLGACNQANGSRASDDGFDSNALARFQCSNSDRGLGCLEEACAVAGGHFARDLKKCSCGTGKTFTVQQLQPRCVTNRVDNECLRRFEGFENARFNSDQLSLCSAFPNNTAAGTQSSNLYIDLESAPENERAIFAHWADTKFWDEFSYQFWESPTAFGDQVSIGGSVTNSFMMEGFLKPFNLPDESVDYINYPPSPKYFTSATEATSFLSERTHTTEIAPALARLGSAHPGLAAAFSAYATMPTDLSYQVDSRYKEGCLRSCVARSERIAKDAYQVWYEKFYFHGALYRSELALADARGLKIATLILADKAVSVGLEFERTNSGLLTKATAFDAKGGFLFTQNGLDSDSLLAERRSLQQNRSNFDLKIGLCEDGLSRTNLESAGLQGSILLGPQPTSYYGWVTPAKSENYWQGRLSLNSYGLVNPGGNSQHATQTASVLLRSGADSLSVGLIPLGIDACIFPNQVSTWWGNFKSSGARVVNLSATEELDPEVCTDSMRDHPLFTDRNAALWVVAAGNQGSNKSRGCPQHFAGLSNLLVVGASDGSSMHRNSNYGETRVDIAAPGEALTGQAWGTSFAAPRVSRVAARIFRLFPGLAPSQVKKAILLGADIPYQPLPIRSRGLLNAEKAERIAQGIARSESLPTLLKDLFCQDRYDDQDYNQRNETRRDRSCRDLDIKLKLNNELDHTEVKP